MLRAGAGALLNNLTKETTMKIILTLLAITLASSCASASGKLQCYKVIANWQNAPKTICETGLVHSTKAAPYGTDSNGAENPAPKKKLAL